MAAVGSTAAIKVVVMGLSGVLGIITSRMIIQNFGTDAYAQYGLLSTFPTLLPFADLGITKVVGMEARGFIFAAPVAVQLGAWFVPVRKAGKLPWTVNRQSYDLEYGTDLLEIHQDAVAPHDRVLVIDDVLDGSDERRGIDTVLKRYGPLTALMGSGYLVADAFDAFAEDPFAIRHLTVVFTH